MNAGIRDDYYTKKNAHGISPRLSATLDLNRIGTFSLSTGLYYQYPSYVFSAGKYFKVEFDNSNGDIEDLELQRNVQGVAGYEKMLSKFVLLGVEGYYKYYDREPLYELDTIMQLPGEAPAGQRKIIADPDKYGTKKAYGMEVYVHNKKMDKFFYQCSYSLFTVKQQYTNGKWYDDDDNLRNCASLIVGSNFHRSHRVSISLDFTEGYPVTPIHEAASDRAKRTLYDLHNGWNDDRRDARVNLSFRYDMTFYFRWGNLTAYAEIENMLHNQDVYQEFYRLGDKYPEGEIKRIDGKGIFPIGGLTIDF
jgi:hypothetical protein